MLSLVLIDLHGNLRKTLRALVTQGPTEQLEVVLVAPDAEAASRRYPELAEFRFVTLRSCGASPTTATAVALGMRAARGDVVAYLEDHVLPEPGWAAAHLAGHVPGVAAVGGTLRNANPDTLVSWAAFIQSFGPFAMPVAGGRSSRLPWHQTSYRRDLLPFGPELERLLENEALLHAELSNAGHALVIECGAVAGHVNPSRLSSLLLHAWWGGRTWGSGRARHGCWSGPQRAANALQVPRIAVAEVRIRLADISRVVPSRRGRVAALTVAAMAIHAAGDVIGMLLGEGKALAALTDVELNRRVHLTGLDREGS